MRSSFLLAWTAAVAPSFDVVRAGTGAAAAGSELRDRLDGGNHPAVVPNGGGRGATYSHCGNTWYTSQTQGTSMTYIVVAPPS